MAAMIKQMPSNLWDTLPKEAKTWFIQERKHLNQARTPGKAPLPAQYNKPTATANKVTTTINLDESIDQYLEDMEEEESTHVVHNVQTIVHTSISQAKVSKCLNILQLGHKDHIAISDDGADTCVIGQGWYILTTDPIRKVTVLGFDHDIAQRTGLPIVTAVTALDLPDKTTILVTPRLNIPYYLSSKCMSLVLKLTVLLNAMEDLKIS